MKKVLSFFVVLLLSACSLGHSKSETPKGKPLILVSVAPYQELTKQVGGDIFQIKSVVPPGVDPHHWEPTYKDVANFESAIVWFTIGEAFESNLIRKLKNANPKIEIVPLSDGVKKIHSSCCSHSHHHAVDTHFWLSPENDIEQAKTIMTTLSNLYPINAKLFKDNYSALKKQLSLLNTKIQNELAADKGNILVTSHGAFTYYAKAYGLEQIVIEPEDGKEPGTRGVVDLSRQIEELRPRIVGIILQPQHSNKAAKMLAKSLDIPTFMIDPYAENYLQTLEELTEIVQKNGKKLSNH